MDFTDNSYKYRRYPRLNHSKGYWVWDLAVVEDVYAENSLSKVKTEAEKAVGPQAFRVFDFYNTEYYVVENYLKVSKGKVDPNDRDTNVDLFIVSNDNFADFAPVEVKVDFDKVPTLYIPDLKFFKSHRKGIVIDVYMSGAYRPFFVNPRHADWNRDVRFDLESVLNKAGRENVDFPKLDSVGFDIFSS